MDNSSIWPQIIQGCVIVVATQLIGLVIVYVRKRRSRAKKTTAEPSLTYTDQILQQIEEQKRARH
jgi:hypothetical protein